MPAPTIAKSPDIFDFIFIIGSDIQNEINIETLTSLQEKGKQVAIIKKTDDYESIRGSIGSLTRIDIHAHGGLIDGQIGTEHWMNIPPIPSHQKYRHVIDKNNKIYIHADSVFSYLTELADTKQLQGLRVHVWGCYSGRAIQSARFLPIGSSLVAHGSAHKPTYNDLSEHYLSSGFNRHPIGLFEEFMCVIAESPNEASFVFNTGGELFIYQSPLVRLVFNNTDEIRNQINSRLNDYHLALRQLEKVDIPLMFNVDDNTHPAVLERYAEESVYLHLSFDDDLFYFLKYLQYKNIAPQHYNFNGKFLSHIAVHRMLIGDTATQLWAYISEKKLGLNELDDQGLAALHYAAYFGDFNAVQRLLQQQGILVDLASNSGHTALHVAAQHGFLNIIDILLQQGADPRHLTKMLKSVLLIAAHYGHLLVVRRLLQHERGLESLNWVDVDNLTPLLAASSRGFTEIVVELAQHGANPNIPYKDGTTAIQDEAQRGYADTVAVLAAYGADLNDFTAADFAVQNGQENINLIKPGTLVPSSSSKPLTLPRLAHLSNYRHDFDYGVWESSIQAHPTTGEPIFTYNAYKNGVEVGGISFYKHPLLCRSEAGDRHNVIATTGIFSAISIDAHSVNDICQALPPTMFDRTVTSAEKGATFGAICGVAHLVGYTLKSLAVRPSIAHYISQATCYSGYFLLSFNAYAAQETTCNTYTAPEEMLACSSTLNAAVKALLDTGSMFITSSVIQWLSQSINQIGESAKQRGFFQTSKLLGFFNKVVPYAIYTHDAGVVNATAGITAGGLTQYMVEQVGEKVVNSLTVPRH